jgi:AcrR family transcriptional regulator
LGTKQELVNTAVHLFTTQGFDSTTTAELAFATGITEPVIYYYFKNKEDLFTYILIKTFDIYFSRLDALDKPSQTQFEKIANLIRFHFRFVKDFPQETFMIVTACPAKLRESGHVCASKVEEQRVRLTNYISECLRQGIKTNEFRKVPIKATTGFLLASVNGLLRRRSLKLDKIKGLEKATIEFCKKALSKGH